MAANTIGTGAVVLTANADQLLVGLNKAQTATEKWATKTTKSAGKVADAVGDKGAGGGGGGGFLGPLLTGGVAGLAAGATMKGLEFVSDIPEMLKSLREVSGQGAGGPLDRMIASVETFQKIGVQLLSTVISPLAPAFERAAALAQGFWERLQPIAASLGERIGGAIFSLVEITGAWLNTFLTGLEAVWPILDKVFRAAEVGLFLFESLYGAIQAGIAMVIQAVSEWIGSWLNLDKVTLTVSQSIFKALKYVAQGAGYVWDAFRFGAGVIAESLGKVVEVALKSVLKAFREVANLAREIPEYLRPDWLDGFIGALDRADGAVAGVGDRMKKWGSEAQTGFGKSAGLFGNAIDALQAKFDARQKQIADSAHKVGEQPITKVELSGAMLAGSNEAYSTVNKFQVGELFAAQNRSLGLDDDSRKTKDPVELAAKQLEATKDVRRILDRIENTLSNGSVLQVLP